MQAQTTTPLYGEEHTGCWFDGCRGIYLGDCIIREAIALGWTCDVAPSVDPPTWQPSPSWADHEHYHELTEEAEEFMQQFAAPGFWFGTSEDGND